MRVLLFFNELSCSAPQPREHVDEGMKRFVAVLREVAKRRGDVALISEVKLQDLELAPGYYLAEWKSQRANVDLWRRIRAFQQRAPFSSVLPPGVGERAEYRFAGRPAKALGAAHLLDGLSVSLPVEPVWNAALLQADRRVLTEDPDGQPILIEESVDVRHASAADHCGFHADWIKQTGLPDLRRGADIWTECGDLFPHLRFLPRTESQFAELRQDWVVPAAQELARIDHAIGDWDPKLTRVPTWRSKVTADSETRKRRCRFEDLDGEVRVFDLHGRFTPGDGRVYFRLDPGARKAIIANIGLKLGI